MSWKKHFTYKGERSVEATVGGREIKFYPNQIGILERLAKLSEPVSRSINLFMGTNGRDFGTQTKSFTEGTGARQVAVEETTIEATSIEAREQRLRERDEAITTLVEMLGDGQNLRIMGLAWMDSMKDIWPRKRGGYGAEAVEEFLFGPSEADREDGDDYEGLDLPQMIQIMGGWMRANSKVFGDLGEKMVGFVKTQMESRLQNASDSDETETEPTSGEGSKTPSSQPSATASNLES